MTTDAPHTAPRRVAVTGSTGKLGRTVVAHLADHGYDVLALDRARPESAVDAVRRRRPHRLRPGARGASPEASTSTPTPVDAVVHLAAIPAPGLTTNAATFANNSAATYNVFAAARALRIRQRRLGVQRDGARAAVRHAAAVRAGRRGVRPAARVDVLAEQGARGGDGPALLPLGPRADHGGPAVLQRHGPRGLRRVPLVRRRPVAAQVEPVGLHRRAATAPRPCGSGSSGPSPGVDVFIIANADTVMSRSQRRPDGRGLPGRRGAQGARRARDPAVHRQGPTRAGLRAGALLARPRRGLTSDVVAHDPGQRRQSRPRKSLRASTPMSALSVNRPSIPVRR